MCRCLGVSGEGACARRAPAPAPGGAVSVGDFPGGPVVKSLPAYAGNVVQPQGWEGPLEKGPVDQHLSEG